MHWCVFSICPCDYWICMIITWVFTKHVQWSHSFSLTSFFTIIIDKMYHLVLVPSLLHLTLMLFYSIRPMRHWNLSAVTFTKLPCSMCFFYKRCKKGKNLNSSKQWVHISTHLFQTMAQLLKLLNYVIEGYIISITCT